MWYFISPDNHVESQSRGIGIGLVIANNWSCFNLLNSRMWGSKKKGIILRHFEYVLEMKVLKTIEPILLSGDFLSIWLI